MVPWVPDHRHARTGRCIKLDDANLHVTPIYFCTQQVSVHNVDKAQQDALLLEGMISFSRKGAVYDARFYSHGRPDSERLVTLHRRAAFDTTWALNFIPALSLSSRLSSRDRDLFLHPIFIMDPVQGPPLMFHRPGETRGLKRDRPVGFLSLAFGPSALGTTPPFERMTTDSVT